MTIQQLEYVIALDNHRHFVTAAEHCFVTQPTLSLQVKKLEDEIGVIIFDRSHNPLTPTSQGELIIAKARIILNEVHQLKEMVTEERDSINGNFKLGIIPTISPYLVPRFFGNFIKAYPDTTLDIDEMQSEDIIKQIELGKIDIGILVTPVNESFLREIPLYKEPFLYYGGDDSPLKPKKQITSNDIDGLPGLWLLNSGHCFRNQVLNICNIPRTQKNISFKSGSIETLKLMVDNYGGYTLIPDMAEPNTSSNAVIIHFKNPKPVREVSIVVHKSFAKEGLIDCLRKEILKVIPPLYEKNNKYLRVEWR
jgi:LysR family transcriptional regulator, hydrogen peroxide-inducible genes activator